MGKKCNQEKKSFNGGYKKTSHIINNILNISIATILLIIAFPVFLIVFLLIKFQNDGPVFYAGDRLGKDKKIFRMYKFRTLSPGAEEIVGANLLTLRLKIHQQLEKKFGRFLRESRLDELPQLFNILKGDMDFVGPRPERPIIYESVCKRISGYDKRFMVKPGLIGYAQLFTPHSAPKRIRSYIDNLYVVKKQVISWDFIFIFYVGWIVFKISLIKLSRILWYQLVLGKILKRFKEKRVFERIIFDYKKYRKQAMIFIEGFEHSTDESKPTARLVNINEEAVLVNADQSIEQNEFKIKLQVPSISRKDKRLRMRVAVTQGKIFRKTNLNGHSPAYQYVIRYTPVSAYNEYKVHQYFLFESMA